MTRLILWFYYTIGIAVMICLIPLVAVVSLVFDED